MRNAAVKDLGESRRKRTYMLEKVGNYWTVGILLIIVIVFTSLSPHFFSAGYWSSTFVYLSEMLLLAVGQTFVVITGGIDLSIGAAEGFIGIIVAIVIRDSLPLGAVPAIIIGVIVGLLTGLLIGFVNGTVITRLNITPFVATLGMMGILTGLTFIVSNGSDIVGLPKQMSELGNIVFFKVIGFSALISWVVAVVGGIVLSKTRFGMHTYSIGSNKEASIRSGINVNKHLTMIYMIAGFVAAISAVLIVFRFNVASPQTGAGVQLNSVAAVAIGGASLFGGVGKMLGSVIGAGIISILITGLVMINVVPYWQQVAIGAIIIGAVYIDQIRQKQ
jgi:ribose transport system permease protein